MKFITTNYSNPCPICQQQNGNCRTTDTKLVLCMTFADAIGEKINGYKCISVTKDKMWGNFLPDNSDSYSSEKQEKYRQFREAQEQAKKEQFKGSLSIEERDKNIRAIARHLGLNKEDRENLLERGLTNEQINEGFYASVGKFSELPSLISTRLAGVYIGRSGNPTIGSDFQQGILCPTFNQDGLITGYQIRRDAKENKYIWASTSAKLDRQKLSSHLPSGELPINFYFSKTRRNQTLWLCDGVLKTYIAHCKHNIDIIGCAGGNFTASMSQLLEITPNYEMVLYALDAGDVLNRNVINRVKRLHNDLSKKGIELNFAYWGQNTKDKNDIDEIEKLEYVVLDLEQLLEVADLEQFRARKKANLAQHTVFTPDIIFNERFVADGVTATLNERGITALNSQLNTGKSYWVKQLSIMLNRPIILIGSRQILTANLAKDLNITYCDKYMDAEDVMALFDDSYRQHRLAIVCDSLLKLKDVSWKDAIVIIDEAEQFLEHLLLAKTHIYSIRPRVLALLGQKLKTVHHILLLDGHLSDFTCNYFADISELPVQKIKNEFQENNRTLFNYGDKDACVGMLAEKKIESLNCFIVGDSAKELTAMYQLDIELGIKSILLTRDNLADHPELGRFLRNKGQAIVDEKIQTVYLSPVGQSGISIEVGDYFDSVFAFINGAISTNTARQMFVRERSNCDRHVWITDKGLGYTTDYEVNQIMEAQDFKEQSLIQDVAYYQQVENLGFGEAVVKVAQVMQNNQNYKSINSLARASLIAKNNIMKSDYHSILIDELKHDGYIIIEDCDKDVSIFDELDKIKDQKEQIDVKQSERVAIAPEIDDIQAELLGKKDGLIESERDKLLKYKIRQFLPDFPLTSGFIYEEIIKHRWERIKAVNNYYLAQHPEIAYKLDFNSFNFVLWNTKNQGFLWTHETHKNGLLNFLYTQLQLDIFINSSVFGTEELTEFLRRCNKVRNELKQFHIKFGKKDQASDVLRKVLKLFGFKVYKTSRKNEVLAMKTAKALTDDVYNLVYRSIETKYSKEIELKYDIIHEIENENAKPVATHEVDMRNRTQDNNFIKQTQSHDSNLHQISTLAILNEKPCNPTNLADTIEIIEDNNKYNYFADEKLREILEFVGINYVLELSDEEFFVQSEQWMNKGLTESGWAYLVNKRAEGYSNPFAELINQSVTFIDSLGQKCEGIISKVEETATNLFYWIKNITTGQLNSVTYDAIVDGI